MDFAEGIRKIIAQHGFAVLHVAPEASRYGYSLTAGLADAGGHELLMVGAAQNKAHAMLNAAVLALAKTPWKGRVREVKDLAGHRAQIVQIEPASLAVDFPVYRTLERAMPQTMLQVLWACQDGRFPGDPQYTALCAQNIGALDVPALH